MELKKVVCATLASVGEEGVFFLGFERCIVTETEQEQCLETGTKKEKLLTYPKSHSGVEPGCCRHKILSRAGMAGFQK